MTNEINLSVLAKVLKKNWWKILIFALVAMIAMAAFTVLFIPKQYSSTMEIYIINTNASYDYTTTSLLGASSYLINDYISIIKGDTLLDELCTALKADGSVPNITPKKIRSMIKTSSSSDSSIFKLSIVDTDPERAYAVASKLAEIAPKALTNIVKSEINDRSAIATQVYNALDYFDDNKHNKSISQTTDDIMAYLEQYNVGLNRQDCISINILPQKAQTPDSPNVPVYTVLAGVIVAVLAYAVFLVLHLSRSVITSEEDVKALLNQPLLGIIPHWSSSGNQN